MQLQDLASDGQSQILIDSSFEDTVPSIAATSPADRLLDLPILDCNVRRVAVCRAMFLSFEGAIREAESDIARLSRLSTAFSAARVAGEHVVELFFDIATASAGIERTSARAMG